MNKLKKDKKITYKMISVCLSLVMMITSFLPMTVQAAGKNEIINSLSDIPAILEDKDTQALGSGKIYYRKADVDIADGTNTSNYQKALQTSFQDDQYKMNTSTSSLVNDWEYLGACLFERARANDTPTKYIKNLTVYGKKDLPEGRVDGNFFLVPNIFEGTDNSLKNAQKKAIDQINNYEVMDGKKMQVFVTAKEASQLSNSNEEGPVYYKTILLPVLDAYLTVQFRAMTVYFHNFKVSPIYPMNEGSYHREISDEQEKSPMYTAGYNNDSGTTVSGTQSLTNVVNYTVTNAVNGSKSYTYEESVSVEYKKALGVFGEITGTIGFNTSQAIENGWSNEKSESKTTETSSEATITLPPYTAAYIRQQQKKQKAVTYYKCPVLINYDVTIVGCNAAATYVLGTFSGSNARASLKNRAVLHPTDTDKDGISWTNIKNDQTADKAINRISRNVLMCTAGGSYTEDLLTAESKVDELIATRPLTKVVADRYDQAMKSGESFSLNQIQLNGMNEKNAVYYGFQSKYGIWKVTDASGDPIENGDITLSGGKGAQKVTAQKEGTYYLTYFIDEDQYHTITNMNHYATNQTVTRPTVKFTVEKVPVNNNTSDTKKDDQTNNTGKNDQTNNTGKNDPQIKNITIGAISDKIASGKKIKLTTNLPKDKVKWTTSNSKLATVDKNGVVKINKKATGKKVIITAIATDGSGKKKTFVIRVMKGEVKKITIKGKKSVKAGKTVKLKAVVKASKGANKKLRWTSNNTKYATVTSSGKVKTKKAGKKKTIKITAMATDGSNKKATIKIKLK
ncbi:aerolysin family beta-barrel pore-forming toxin [Anaerostipes hadrus]|uniref:Ig-like domain-containing protein n=1 Tax=Anaerostipes hadrus TaxID=649756 RepID=UPI0015711EE2|nr:Ig-like domain-containing protein [Anaerostipes hadrus]NSH02627.1 aerolysin family beta-barrel pore-forming toxin [Anaerostipes hadrus]NSH33080.1 aerolysin family beta-barrel pore-forming toxin [Anaerostipes hadrus]